MQSYFVPKSILKLSKNKTLRKLNLLFQICNEEIFCHFLLAFAERQPATPPLNLHRCASEIASDYTKKQNVLRLRLVDGAEFLLEFHNSDSMRLWQQKIQHYAGETHTGMLHLSRVARLGPKVGEIGHKWDKTGLFQIRFQYILAR